MWIFNTKIYDFHLEKIYWALGNDAIVNILEAPDNASMAVFVTSISVIGNVRTIILRVFSEADMNGILAKPQDRQVTCLL
ncbi:GYD domain-containing protein [Nitrosomonas communis]|uniref:GYD domain-containing protein n=1 Tax=Nitrosomonas communis TaxID=44574 RepID=UPI0009F38081